MQSKCAQSAVYCNNTDRLLFVIYLLADSDPKKYSKLQDFTITISGKYLHSVLAACSALSLIYKLVHFVTLGCKLQRFFLTRKNHVS